MQENQGTWNVGISRSAPRGFPSPLWRDSRVQSRVCRCLCAERCSHSPCLPTHAADGMQPGCLLPVPARRWAEAVHQSRSSCISGTPTGPLEDALPVWKAAGHSPASLAEMCQPPGQSTRRCAWTMLCQAWVWELDTGQQLGSAWETASHPLPRP